MRCYDCGGGGIIVVIIVIIVVIVVVIVIVIVVVGKEELQQVTAGNHPATIGWRFLGKSFENLGKELNQLIVNLLACFCGCGCGCGCGCSSAAAAGGGRQRGIIGGELAQQFDQQLFVQDDGLELLRTGNAIDTMGDPYNRLVFGFYSSSGRRSFRCGGGCCCHGGQRKRRRRRR